MIERYSRPAMAAVWAETGKFDAWLRVEIAVCEAWAAEGAVPAAALPAIRRARYDLDRMKVIEAETGHDVIAFLRSLGESIGDEARYIHLGLTSTDVVDTALALQIGEAGRLLLGELGALEDAVTTLALAHRGTVMIGRTHGIHAEPTTFGFKLLTWVQALRHARERLTPALEDLRVGKLAGAVGTHANLPPTVEERALDLLGLRAAAVGTQVLGRDLHAHFLCCLAGLAASLEMMATEVRHLQRTEVREAAEPFGEGQQGSSAMPHKRNPVLCERICGLARVVRGYAQTGLENVALWHERDISHSSAERVILPDACLLTDYMLAQLREVVAGMEVDAVQMRRNLESSGGLIFSQRVLLALVERGMSRQAAYKLVQEYARRAWKEERPFRELLAAEPAITVVLDEATLAELFDMRYHLRYIDEGYRRMGIGIVP
ncbi:MAG TPA: adenylosuccinate lyase [Chloroflexota bacterium]|nr:adenylosuccinate lyase [Chloroflexota bacterium]